MWSFVIGFFHLASCFQGSSLLEHLSILHIILLLNNTSLYGYTIFLLMLSLDGDIWIFSCFLATMSNFAKKFTYNYLCGCVFISHGCRIREITGSYGNSVYFFKEVMNCFPKQLYYFTFRSAKHSGSSFLQYCQHLLFSVFFFLILNFVKVFQVFVKCFTCGFDLHFPSLHGK